MASSWVGWWTVWLPAHITVSFLCHTITTSLLFAGLIFNHGILPKSRGHEKYIEIKMCTPFTFLLKSCLENNPFQVFSLDLVIKICDTLYHIFLLS